MKASSQLLWLTMLVTIFSIGDSSAQLLNEIRTKNRIEVTFNNTLKEKDLEIIKAKLREHGIMLTYDYLDFDTKGKLVGIEFTVDCKDGFSGSAGLTGNDEEHMLTKDSRFGFFRDYAADATYAKPAFKAGQLDDEHKE